MAREKDLTYDEMAKMLPQINNMSRKIGLKRWVQIRESIMGVGWKTKWQSWQIRKLHQALMKEAEEQAKKQSDEIQGATDR